MYLRDWLRRFQKADLYSKSAVLPKVEEIRPYYEYLMDKYIPGLLRW